MSDLYLKEMPCLPNHGLNKILITRALTIDYKHRDSEMFLRNNNLIDTIKKRFDMVDILKTRSMQLRYIYHINRKVFINENPNLLVDFLTYFKNKNFVGFGDNCNIFIDYMSIINGDITDKKLIKESLLFSFHAKQTDMIKYFVKNNIPFPKLFLIVKNFDELNSYLVKNLSFVLYKDNTFSHEEKIYMWLCNYYIYETHLNNSFENIRYKTDLSLGKPTKLY